MKYIVVIDKTTDHNAEELPKQMREETFAEYCDAYFGYNHLEKSRRRRVRSSEEEGEE